MSNNTIYTFTLNGDFSMAGVRDQWAALAQNIAHIVEAGRQQLSACELDLTGVQVLDACGCQLLVTIFRTLAKYGASTFSIRLSDDFRNKIRLLGFEEEIITRNCA